MAKTPISAPNNQLADKEDPVSEALNEILVLANNAELYAAHDQAGVLRVKIQALVAQAKAAL